MASLFQPLMRPLFSRPVASWGTHTRASGGGVFFDNFDRATEPLSASPKWTFVSGSAASVAVNDSQSLSTSDTSSPGTAYQSPDLGRADHWVQATVASVPSANAGPVLCCRLQDANNWVGIRFGSGTWQFYKRIAGVLTLLGSFTYTTAPGDVFSVSAVGDDVSVTINGAVRITGTLGGDLAGVTRQGVVARLTAAPSWIDNYRAGNF